MNVPGVAAGNSEMARAVSRADPGARAEAEEAAEETGRDC
jgi:hypothetical protein